MCGCDDGEQPKVFTQRLRKAAPPRGGNLSWCCECNRTIRLDEWHEESSGYWESWGRYRTCLRCVARRQAWSALECSPPFGKLAETIVECLVTSNYDGRVGRSRRHIDRETGRDYMRHLRAARADVRTAIEREQASRLERKRAAARARWGKAETQTATARRFGVRQTHVSNIQLGKSYADVR